jgi:hypothetical protein
MSTPLNSLASKSRIHRCLCDVSEPYIELELGIALEGYSMKQFAYVFAAVASSLAFCLPTQNALADQPNAQEAAALQKQVVTNALATKKAEEAAAIQKQAESNAIAVQKAPQSQSALDPNDVDNAIKRKREELAAKEQVLTKQEARKLLSAHHAIMVVADEAKVKDKAKAKAQSKAAEWFNRH